MVALGVPLPQQRVGPEAVVAWIVGLKARMRTSQTLRQAKEVHMARCLTALASWHRLSPSKGK